MAFNKSIPGHVIDRCASRHGRGPFLTFFDFPKDEWVSFIIERLSKKFKRRTKPMEIVAGEHACYRFLAFISFKMELHGRSNPVEKVCSSLQFLNELAYKKFTHKS